jgi:hypothetical protein
MHTDTLSQINEVINSLVKKGNFKQANNLNQLFLKMAQAPAAPVSNAADPTGVNPTPPPGTPPPPSGKPQQGSNTGTKQPTVDMMNIIKQFIALKEWAKEKDPPAFYSYSRGLFFADSKEGKRISAPTVGELFPLLGVTSREVKELAGDVQQQANKISAEIASANSWTGASPEGSKAINDKYDLGYNFEKNQYYIADPNSANDAEFRESVADLQQVYNELGAYYNAKKSLPPNLAARKGTIPENSEDKEKAAKGLDVSKMPTDSGSPTDMTNKAALPAEVDTALNLA